MSEQKIEQASDIDGFCRCDPPMPALARVGGVLRHVAGCGRQMACEFSYLTDGALHAATTIHVDYLVCEAHVGAAVDNVSGRDQA